MTPGREWVLIAGMILLGLVLRAVALGADPPAVELDGRGVFRTDEGLYAHGAVTRARTGAWPPPGDFNALPFSPLYSLSLWGLFSVFGVSLAAARLLGVASGLLGSLAIYGALRNWGEGRAARLGALLFLVLDSLLLAHQRLALLEPLLLALLSVSLWLASLGGREARGPVSRWSWWAAGAAFGLAVTVKPTAMFFAAVLAAAAWWSLPDFRARAGALLRAGAGAAVVGALWVLVFVLPYMDDWTSYLIRMGSSRSQSGILADPVQGLLNLFKLLCRSVWLPLSPLALAGLALFPLVRASTAARVLLAWTIVGAFAVGNYAYQPLRYQLVFVMPLVALAGLAVGTGWKLRREGRRLVAAAAACLLLGTIAFHVPASLRRLGEARTLEAAARELSAHVPAGATVAGDLACALELAGADWSSRSIMSLPEHYGPMLLADPPAWLVADDPAVPARLQADFPALGVWVPVASVDLMGNYYKPWLPVTLYRRQASY